MFNFNLVLQTLKIFYFYFSSELDVVKAHIKLKIFFSDVGGQKGRGRQPTICLANLLETLALESILAKRCAHTSGRTLSQIRNEQRAR